MTSLPTGTPPSNNQPPTLRLRLSDPEHLRSAASQDSQAQYLIASFNTYIETDNQDNDELLILAREVHILLNAIEDDESQGRGMGISDFRYSKLIDCQSQIQTLGRSRHHDSMSEMFSSAHRLLYGKVMSDVDQLTKLRKQLEDLSAIMKYFGTPQNQQTINGYIQETKTQQTSLYLQKGRNTNIDFIRSFNSTPEHYNQINLGTLDMFSNRLSELFSALGSSNHSREELIDIQRDLTQLQTIITLIRNSYSRFSQLHRQDPNQSSQSLLIFLARENRINRELRNIEHSLQGGA